MIKFSIITVCRNAENLIRKTIESVFLQSYYCIELIVIDGASTDKTLAILEDYSEDKRLFVFSENDSGIYNAMNKGITKASGDYLYFLNAGDTFYDNDVLRKVSEYIARNDSDILIGNYIEKRHEVSKIIRMSDGWNLNEILPQGIGVCHQAVFAKRNCLQNGFDEKYKVVADYEWLCRQYLFGRKIEWVDVIISEYDLYGVSSLAKNWMKTKEERRQIVETYFFSMRGKIEERLKNQFESVKNQKNLECLNDMLALRQKNKSIMEYFRKRSIYKIAIYGFQWLGQRLLGELEGSEISVSYIIDRDHSFQNPQTALKFLEDDLEDVDAIVITPIFEFYNIKQILHGKVQTEIISIEDIINSMYTEF